MPTIRGMSRQHAASYSPPQHELPMTRAQRRALGAYYTPPEVVRLIVDLALQPAIEEASGASLRVIDPACGAGEFLEAAAERMIRRFGSAAGVFGIDIDAQAIAAARQRLPGECAVWCGDGLDEQAVTNRSFDVVIGNPPYLSIRQLAKSLQAGEIESLRRRFRTARGNFDLYVLFIERALALLKPGGRCGFVVPNKWATLDYARACRELLLERTTIEHVVDLSAERVFASASVYPHVVVFRKQPAAADHRVLPHSVRQSSLSPGGFSFVQPLDVESRVLTQPLGAMARLSCGTAGYAAKKIARCLIDTSSGEAGANHPRLRCGLVSDFITSGNIDRYAIRLGDVRYMGRTYQRPQLPADAPELSAAKRRLFASPKIVIAGMSRRIEAAWEEQGLALGVQVYAASDFAVDPHFLLAVLNSKLLSYLFATRFAAKRLAGGYLAINKGQLEKLPIVAGTFRVPPLQEQLSHLGRLLSGPARRPPLDDEADRLVYRLYGLSREEIEPVEAHFAQLAQTAPRRAA